MPCLCCPVRRSRELRMRLPRWKKWTRFSSCQHRIHVAASDHQRPSTGRCAAFVLHRNPSTDIESAAKNRNNLKPTGPSISPRHPAVIVPSRRRARSFPSAPLHRNPLHRERPDGQGASWRPSGSGFTTSPARDLESSGTERAGRGGSEATPRRSGGAEHGMSGRLSRLGKSGKVFGKH